MPSEYETVRDNTPFIRISGEEWCLQCCDCGLVHRIKVAISDVENKVISMELTRDNRKTAAARRAGNVYLLQEKRKNKWKMTRD